MSTSFGACTCCLRCCAPSPDLSASSVTVCLLRSTGADTLIYFVHDVVYRKAKEALSQRPRHPAKHRATHSGSTPRWPAALRSRRGQPPPPTVGAAACASRDAHATTASKRPRKMHPYGRHSEPARLQTRQLRNKQSHAQKARELPAGAPPLAAARTLPPLRTSSARPNSGPQRDDTGAAEVSAGQAPATIREAPGASGTPKGAGAGERTPTASKERKTAAAAPPLLHPTPARLVSAPLRHAGCSELPARRRGRSTCPLLSWGEGKDVHRHKRGEARNCRRLNG